MQRYHLLIWPQRSTPFVVEYHLFVAERLEVFMFFERATFMVATTQEDIKSDCLPLEAMRPGKRISTSTLHCRVHGPTEHH